MTKQAIVVIDNKRGADSLALRVDAQSKHHGLCQLFQQEWMHEWGEGSEQARGRGIGRK
jgi:hypothetical protein